MEPSIEKNESSFTNIFTIKQVIKIKNTSADCILYAFTTKKLLLGCDNKKILIYNPKTLNCEGQLIGHTHIILCLSEMQNGFILSSSWDKTIRMWNVIKKECIKVSPIIHSWNIPKVIQLKDERICSCGGQEIILWDENLNKENILIQKNMDSEYKNIFEVKENEIVSYDNNSLIFWNLNTMQLMSQFTGFKNDDTTNMIFKKPNYLIFRNDYEEENSINIMDINSYEIKYKIYPNNFKRKIICFYSLPNGYIIIGDNWGEFQILNNNFILEKETIKIHDYEVSGIAYFGINSIITSCNKDNTINIVNYFI